ncbi:MAG: helix-turn-helix domain-containing protein [Clostridiaceae bacterium]|mgnify:CR=1 FL=1|nr:helix-turn-helix domain-containing protein [Clostridiaceae bacterium]
MKYITASEAAKKWGITQRRVQVLCSQGRVKGTFKLGENWAIPENASKPTDKRLREGAEELGE